LIIACDMPVIDSIPASSHPASRSFSQLDARSPWKTKPERLIFPVFCYTTLIVRNFD
jgi:hypothetical protein